MQGVLRQRPAALLSVNCYQKVCHSPTYEKIMPTRKLFTLPSRLPMYVVIPKNSVAFLLSSSWSVCESEGFMNFWNSIFSFRHKSFIYAVKKSFWWLVWYGNGVLALSCSAKSHRTQVSWRPRERTHPYVHGDLSEPSIICSGSRVLLVWEGGQRSSIPLWSQ